jgi:prepilin-type N-terminal cleavage/methylation domain-containing protein
MRSKGLKKESGFTLIELLVVISIVAVMISLLLPALASSRNLAQRANCAAQLHSIGQAFEVYADTYNNQYPVNSELSLPFEYMINGYNNTTQNWNPAGFSLLYTSGTLTVPQMFYCPQSGYYGPDSAINGSYLPTLVDKGYTINWLNIAYSYCYYYAPANTNNFWGQDTDEPQIQFSSGPNSSNNTILAGDMTMAVFNDFNWPASPASNHMTSGNTPDGGNELYNDGSVRWHNFSQMHMGYSWLGIFNFYQ